MGTIRTKATALIGIAVVVLAGTAVAPTASAATTEECVAGTDAERICLPSRPDPDVTVEVTFCDPGCEYVEVVVGGQREADAFVNACRIRLDGVRVDIAEVSPEPDECVVGTFQETVFRVVYTEPAPTTILVGECRVQATASAGVSGVGVDQVVPCVPPQPLPS